MPYFQRHYLIRQTKILHKQVGVKYIYIICIYKTKQRISKNKIMLIEFLGEKNYLNPAVYSEMTATA